MHSALLDAFRGRGQNRWIARDRGMRVRFLDHWSLLLEGLYRSQELARLRSLGAKRSWYAQRANKTASQLLLQPLKWGKPVRLRFGQEIEYEAGPEGPYTPISTTNDSSAGSLGRASLLQEEVKTAWKGCQRWAPLTWNML